MEWANAVRSTFDPVVHTHLFPRAQIDLVVHVLQQDGGMYEEADCRCLTGHDSCVHARTDGRGHTHV